MKGTLHLNLRLATIFCTLFALSAWAFQAAAKEPMLYDISADDIGAEIFDSIKEREREMIRAGRASNASGKNGGEQADGLRVVLLFDVSRSVVNESAQSGLPMTKIKEEVLRLVDSLKPSTQFNVVQFTRNYLPFEKSLVPADEKHRKSFRTWVREKWNDSGKLSATLDGATKNPDGIIGVLGFTKEMKPDVVYLISDGSFEQGGQTEEDKVAWSAVRKAFDALSQGGKKVPVNFIAFAPDQTDAEQMKKIATSSGGRFRQVTKSKS